MHSARLRHIRQMHKGMEEPEDREDDTNVVTCRICDAKFKRDQIGKHLTKTHKVTKGTGNLRGFIKVDNGIWHALWLPRNVPEPPENETLMVKVNNGKIIVHGIEIEVPENRVHDESQSSQEDEDIGERKTVLVQEMVEMDETIDRNELPQKQSVVRSLFPEAYNEYDEEIEERLTVQDEIDETIGRKELHQKQNVVRSLFPEVCNDYDFENEEVIAGQDEIEERITVQDEIVSVKSKQNALIYPEVSDEIFNEEDMDYAISVDESRIIDFSQISVNNSLTDTDSDDSSYEEEGDSNQFRTHLREMKKKR